MALPDWAVQDGDAKFAAGKGVLAKGMSLNALAGVFQLFGSFFSTILLSRIIGPEDFGIYGMVLPFVTVLTILADGGSVYHTLRDPRVEERNLNLSFWYCVTISVALSLVMLPLAPAIAAIMGEPRAEGAALAAGLAIIAIGLGFQHNALIMRCFRNDLRALTIISSVIVSVVVAVAAALLGAGYWALVLLFVVRTAVQTLAAWYLTGWRPGWPRVHVGRLRQVMGLGLPELYSRLLLNVIRDLDKVLVGILFSTATTGFYALAHMLCIMPLRQVLSPVFAVVIPYLSESRSNPLEVFLRFERLFGLFVFLMWPASVFFAIYADLFMGIVVGAEMAPAAQFVAPLLLAGILSMTGSFVSIAFQAMDHPMMTARHNTWMGGIMLLCLLCGAMVGTPLAVAYAIVLANLISLRMRWLDLGRFFRRRPWKTMRNLWVPLVMTVALPMMAYTLDGWMGLRRAVSSDLLYALAVLLVYGALAAAATVTLYRDDVRALKAGLRSKSARKPAAGAPGPSRSAAAA